MHDLLEEYPGLTFLAVLLAVTIIVAGLRLAFVMDRPAAPVQPARLDVR